MGLFKSIIKTTKKNIRVVKKLTKSEPIKDTSGKLGEEAVNKQLNPLIFGRVKHRQINNLIIKDENNFTHQIDHIEIRENGIFVIETKSLSGQIYGRENSRTWTQYFYNNEKYEFVNPLLQNKSHVYYINQLLQNKYKINSLVVFAQNNADKVNIHNVINLSELKGYLSNYDDGTRLSITDIDRIYNILISNNANISNKEHVKNIKQMQYNINNNICPRCNSELQLKHGQYGDFYGCSNYPKCKFTMKINK